jgi:hypothetical protein
MGRLPFRIEDIRGRRLPKEWAERAGIGPDEAVSVAIGPSREEAPARLKSLMHQAAMEAHIAGLSAADEIEAIPDFPRDLLKS